MYLLEQIAYYGREYVQEEIMPNAKAQKIWFSQKTKDARNAIKDANALFKSGDRKEAKSKYIYAREIFKDIKKELDKITGSESLAELSFFIPIVGYINLMWSICSKSMIDFQLGEILKLRQNQVDILNNKKDYDIDEPRDKKALSVAVDDIITYCDAMIKKC